MSHPSAFGPYYPQPEPQQLQLVVHAGPLAGKGFPITGDMLTFGRGQDNDIVLDDTQVSRNHARLLIQGDEIVLEDLGSTNGTLVNGKPVAGQHVLQPADIISIGSSVFGVKGFAAPATMGITQISPERPTYAPPMRPPSAEPPLPSFSGPAVPRPPSRPAQPEGLTNWNLLMIGGVLALVVTVLAVAALTAYFLTRNRGPAAAEVPAVVITAPVAGSQVQVNVPVTIQTTASSAAGVVRIELWVSGLKTAEAVSPVPQGQPTLTASFQWTAAAPGSYTLEIRAYNQQGAVSNPTMVTVNAVGAPPANSPTPTPPTQTPTPGTPTATVPSVPSLTTQTDLNVRAGPSTQYDLLGLLPVGSTVEVLGRDETRQWWQVRFSPAPNQLGWVASDAAYSKTYNVDNVPVVQAPPTPTPIPSATPIPPTNTPIPPTNTPIPPTDTPTPTSTPTATGVPTVIQFNVSPTTIQGGECVQITWNVAGVREVYFEDEGVGGSNNFTDCPRESKTYTLRVIKLDGATEEKDIDVTVINPIVSSGSLKLNPGESVDLDRGNIPGDDFVWIVDGGNRRFEVQGGVLLAPMRDISALPNLSLNDCANATFGTYTFIDASDVIADPANELIDGRSACYRTSEGRLGKLRFPDYSTGTLRIEWLTWK